MADKSFLDSIGARLIALGILGLSGWGLYGLNQSAGSNAAMASAGDPTEAFVACIAVRGQAFDQLLAQGQMTKEQVVTAKARLAPVCRIEAGGP